MRRIRIVWLGVVLAALLAGGTAALNYWLRRPVDQALISAVKRNDTSMVRLLLLKGADPNTKDEAHLSLATWALLANHADIAELLLDRGAQVDADFCLQDALDNNRTDQVPLLLKHGAHGNRVQPANGASILALGATSGADVVRLLLDQGVPVTGTDEQGHTALMNAALASQAETVDLLLQHGADYKAKDTEGNTALHLACQGLDGQDPEQGLKVIRLLLSHGADPTTPNRTGDWPLTLVDRTGQYQKLGKEQREAIVLLATGAADPDVRDRSAADTLWWAVKGNRRALVDALLDARVNPNEKTEDGDVPLVVATREIAQDHPRAARDIALALLKRGADPNQADHTGASARKVAEAFLETYKDGQRRQLYATLLPAMNQRVAPGATSPREPRGRLH